MDRDRLIRYPEVKEMTGLPRTTIGRLEKQGLFPHRITILDRAVVWSFKDVTHWISAVIDNPKMCDRRKG